MLDTVIPLSFSQQEMISFLENLRHKSNYNYEIDFEIRTFYKDDILDPNADPIYEKESIIIKSSGIEITCPDEKNFTRKQHILVEEFTKRFKEKLLNC